jgi:hypothetical protein
MEAELLSILRSKGAEQLCQQINTEARRQSAEAQATLRQLSQLFTVQPATLTVNSKEEYWNMTKAERNLWQKSKEEERRRINEEQGIDSKGLLTKENVEMWRAQGLTFAAIARDIVGLPSELVASVAKDKPYVKARVYARKN